MKKLLLILFSIGCFFFLSTKLYAQSNQTVTNGSNTTTVNFAGSCTYNWVNNDPSIGLAASGTGNIPSFTAVNTGKNPVTATITATPVAESNMYIANTANNTLEVINTTNDAIVATIPTQKYPIGVSVNPDKTRVYVSDQNPGGQSSVSVINTSNNSLIATVPVGVGAWGIVTSPDGKWVYVANETSGTVSVIDASTNTLYATIPIPAGAVGIAVSPDGSYLYVAATYNTNSYVVVINTTTNSVLKNIPVSGSLWGLAVSPDGSKLYVTNPGKNTVAVINTSTNTIIATIPVGDFPNGIVISPDGKRVYVTNDYGNSISVIDANTNIVITTIPDGQSPGGVSVTPDGKYLYVNNTNSNAIAVFDTQTNALINSLSIGQSGDSQTLGNFLIFGTDCSGPATTFTIIVNPASFVPTVTTGPVSGNISACVGMPSASPSIQQFVVSGNNLTNDIQIKAPANFEVSLNPIGGYGNTLMLTQTGWIVKSITIYVRSATSAPAGNIIGNINIISSGTISQNVSVYGVVNAPPVVNLVSNQNYANGSITTGAIFTGTASSFSWTNDTPGIGLAASGIGNISSFTAINTGNSPVTATITVTPEMPSLAYIANNQYSLSVIDLNTNTVVANIPVGQSPIGTAVDKYNNRVYVANQASHTISVINSITNTVTATINTNPGSDPSGLALSPNGTRLYVTNYSDKYLTVINTADNSIIASIPVGQYAWGLAVSPDGNFVYVVQAGDNNISVVNTATNKVIGTLPAGTTPNDIQISPDGTYLYVSNYGSNDVTVINTQTNAISATVNIGVVPEDEAISPDGSRLYVTNINDNTVTVINTLNNTVITTIKVNNHPEGLCFSADGTKVYVINSNSGNLSVINTSDYTVSTGISVGISMTFGKFISSGSGCPGTPVTFTITVNPALPPTVTADGSLTPLTTIYGSPSSINRFTVSGTAITSGILITPPAGFEVSLDEKAFSPTVTVNGTGNIPTTAIFIRLASSTHVGSYSGNVIISTNNAADATLMVPVSTVTPATLTITADNKTKPVNVVNPPLTVTYSGFVNGDGPAQLTVQPEITTAATISSAVGEYTISVGNADSPDYIFHYNAGTLTITPFLSMASIPNTFTPNGDGINDTWMIKDIAYYPKSTVNIFNRWGQKVFTSIGYPIPWDGIYQGKTLPSGTYYFIIDIKNGQAALAGWVAIIR